MNNDIGKVKKVSKSELTDHVFGGWVLEFSRDLFYLYFWFITSTKQIPNECNFKKCFMEENNCCLFSFIFYPCFKIYFSSYINIGLKAKGQRKWPPIHRPKQTYYLFLASFFFPCMEHNPPVFLQGTANIWSTAHCGWSSAIKMVASILYSLSISVRFIGP